MNWGSVIFGVERRDQIKLGKNVQLSGWLTVSYGGRITIGDRSIVAAGAIVTKDIPPDTIVAGNPAKIVKKSNQIL